MVQAGEHHPGFFAGLFTYPCQVSCHRGFTPCIASMFLLARSAIRGDLRSAEVSRFIARPLRRTGPHHLRRGHPGTLFSHWARYSGVSAVDCPRAWNVARLVTCLSWGRYPQQDLVQHSLWKRVLFAEGFEVWKQLDAVLDPGETALRSSLARSPHGLRQNGKDRLVPNIRVLGALCQIQGYTLQLAALAFPPVCFRFQSLHY